MADLGGVFTTSSKSADSALRVETNPMPSVVTQYGFKFGAATVDRLVSHKGYVVIGVKTPRQRIEIMVTPSGLIRVGKLVRNLAPKTEG